MSSVVQCSITIRPLSVFAFTFCTLTFDNTIRPLSDSALTVSPIKFSNTMRPLSASILTCLTSAFITLIEPFPLVIVIRSYCFLGKCSTTFALLNVPFTNINKKRNVFSLRRAFTTRVSFSITIVASVKFSLSFTSMNAF